MSYLKYRCYIFTSKVLYLNGGHPTWGALDYVKLFAFTLCSFSPHRAIAAVCRYTCFFLCHNTFEGKSLPQEAKLNVDQCLAPFAESRTKLTGENLWNWKSVFTILLLQAFFSWPRQRESLRDSGLPAWWIQQMWQNTPVLGASLCQDVDVFYKLTSRSFG